MRLQPKKIQNLLVIRLGALGDCMHVLPSLSTVKAIYPHINLHWLTLPVFHPLLEPHVAHCWAYEKPQGVLKQALWLRQLAQQLKKVPIDGVINLHPSLKTHILSQLLGVPTAIYRKQKLTKTGMAERTTPRRHATDDFYQPFRTLLPDLPETPLHPPVLHGLQPSRLDNSYHWAVILGVGNKRPNRAWPLSHWQQWLALLCAYFKLHPPETPLHLHLIGGPEEAPLADAFQQAFQPTPETAPNLILHNHVGQTTVVEMAQLLARCHLALGGDTGPLHVAAAAGTPEVIGLFAPTSVTRTGPNGSGHLQTLTPPASLTCWPCEKPICKQLLPCMTEISPQTVAEACLATLANRQTLH